MNRRRKPTASELAELLPIAATLEAMLAAEAEQPDDRGFAKAIDRKVTEPIRNVVRQAAAVWCEPHLGMLTLCLTKCDQPVDRLYNGKMKRKKALAALAEVPFDLRRLAEMQA